MSKHRIVFALLCLCTTFIFSEGNYQGGNGTVISRITDEKQTIEIRKLEISNVKAGDMLADSDNTIYDSYTTQNPLGELEWWREKFNIHQICSIELQEKDPWGQTPGEMWLEISTMKLRGWICCDSNFPRNLYKNQNYSILEKITTASRTWTVRKLEQTLSLWRNLDITDTPGSESSVIHSIRNGGRQMNFQTVAITEEQETINGKTDCWVKIEYEQGKYGWAFGGYLEVERGGPKYRIPEAELEFMLGNQP